ncbi:MAG: C1 family peptidase [Candidatus Sericytochromatia bacterium]
MTLKKPFLSTLLASITLMSVIACQPQVSTDLSAVSDTNVSNSSDDVNALSVSQIKAKYKLNYKINSSKNKLTKLGNPTNALSRKVVDLRPEFQQVYDQGNLGSCTAFSMTKGLREFLLKKSGKWVKLSALEFYYKEREIDGTVSEDAGSLMDTGMNVLKNHGVALDADWPYNIAKFAVEPPAAVQAKAAQYKVGCIGQLDTLEKVKNVLDAGYPVAFGTKVPSSFMSPVNGMIAKPNPDTDTIEGGHAVLAVGYDDTKKAIIMRNSWGNFWGKAGYAYLPYEYWSTGYVMDSWSAAEAGSSWEGCSTAKK